MLTQTVRGPVHDKVMWFGWRSIVPIIFGPEVVMSFLFLQVLEMDTISFDAF